MVCTTVKKHKAKAESWDEVIFSSPTGFILRQVKRFILL